MRQTALDTVYELARRDDRIVFIGSDLGAGTLQRFRDEMPDRFFMEGVSEASIVGMAAGLALEGRIVYVNTIATFLTRRCFEQVAVDLCLHDVKVRLIGSGGGLVYAPLGPTHLAIEDIAIFRALPRMAVVAPADAVEMRRLLIASVEHPGPLYIRMGKGGDPIVTDDREPFEIGRAVVMREGGEALIVSTGVMLKPALDAADGLATRGIEAAVLHVPTVKPFDTEALRKWAARVTAIVSVEEHTLIGGLGSAVAETLAETDFATPKRFRRLALPDEFPDEYGSQASLMARYGLKAGDIEATVVQLLAARAGTLA